MHIGESEVAALGAEGKLSVVETEQVENGGVEIVDVDFIFDGVEAEFVGFAVLDTAFDAAAGHPHGEGIRVVVAAIAATLDHRSATEFSAPDDESFIEQPALLEVFQKRGASLVHFFAAFF